jgi:hypothetical protein
MKKALRQAAGTAVLGVALAAAAVTPASADALGGALGGLPTGALPSTDSLPLVGAQSSSVHAVTGTAQGLVDTAAPSVQGLTQSAPGLGAPTAPRAMPPALTSGLPLVGQLPAVGGLSDLGQESAQTTSSLNHLTTGLPVHTTFPQQ